MQTTGFPTKNYCAVKFSTVSAWISDHAVCKIGLMVKYHQGCAQKHCMKYQSECIACPSCIQQAARLEAMHKVSKPHNGSQRSLQQVCLNSAGSRCIFMLKGLCPKRRGILDANKTSSFVPTLMLFKILEQISLIFYIHSFIRSFIFYCKLF